MSGCFPTYTVGNVAYQAVGGYACSCPCHFPTHMGIYPPICNCSCNRTQKFELISDNTMALTLKNMQLQVDVLRRTVEYLQKCIKRTPHACPICDGKCGHTVYIEEGLEETFIDCKACQGKGVLWVTTTEELTQLHREEC